MGGGICLISYVALFFIRFACYIVLVTDIVTVAWLLPFAPVAILFPETFIIIKR